MHLQYLSTETQQQLLSATATAYMAATAIAISYAIPIPTSVVNDINQEVLNVKPTAASIAGWFNEARPLNLDETLDMAMQLWKARYEVAHGQWLEQTNYSGTVLDLFGIGYVLSGERACLLQENHKEIGCIVGAAVKAARQMQLNLASKEV